MLSHKIVTTTFFLIFAKKNTQLFHASCYGNARKWETNVLALRGYHVWGNEFSSCKIGRVTLNMGQHWEIGGAHDPCSRKMMGAQTLQEAAGTEVLKVGKIWKDSGWRQASHAWDRRGGLRGGMGWHVPGTMRTSVSLQRRNTLRNHLVVRIETCQVVLNKSYGEGACSNALHLRDTALALRSGTDHRTASTTFHVFVRWTLTCDTLLLPHRAGTDPRPAPHMELRNFHFSFFILQIFTQHPPGARHPS